MKHLKQINNFWIFPVLLMAASVFLIIEFSWSSSLLCLYLCYRIIYTRNKLLVLISLVAVGIITFSCVLLLNKEKQPKFPENSEQIGELTVLPDQLRIDGDGLQMEGLFSSQTQKRKVIAFYRFSSEQEKQYWEQTAHVLTMQIVGNVETPLPQTNLHGFDYQKYLKTKGIYQTITISSIQEVCAKKRPFWDVFSWISICRKKAIDYCSKAFMRETALYIQTLLFGFRSSDFFQKEAALANLGILHLFSLSGMHVTFFIGSFRYLFLRSGLSVEKVFWLQLLFSVIYAGFTGFSVSVVRALVQRSIMLTNRRFSWKLSGLDCWSFTLMIGLLVQPYVLFSIGGQLSYGLSFIIIVVDPITERISNRYLKSYCFSLLLNIAILPLVGLSFFEWQITGSIFTFFLLPLFERIILPVLTFSFFSSFFVQFDFWRVGLEFYFLLQQQLVDWLNDTSTFSIVTGHFPFWLFLVAAFLEGLLLNQLVQRSKKAYLAGILLFLLVHSKYASPKGTVAIIDVGQGDSLFIQTPFHQENILLDTGGKLSFEKEKWATKSKQKSNAEYSVVPYLKSKGVKYLDKVLISHGDIDHCGDLLAIHKKVPIRALYFPAGTENKGVFRKMLETLKKAGVKCYPVLATQSLGRSLSLQVLAPAKAGRGENEDSLVVYTKVAGQRFLFTGDLDIHGENQLIKHFPNLKIDVLKAGHHGSRTSTDRSFIKQISPTDVVISCGRNNRFKHPHEEVLTTLEQEKVTIFRTDLAGMVYYEWTPWTKLSPAQTIIKHD
ncbi:DNA internalization-related competence protein ComEC/Rec2 [Enterococcus termitis]|uniref:DNA internalization-related competence protein ComEC/Rec2 n=1 Tax=Enterococcus termitis TaxID=332950 RepID=A0A1E5GZ80_9ENTE|nr:DNA internalization-related competence protein ComEC/Rec2 [Enterococcus termitis]OEG17987.1 DNA internalization-related competence protein ComEC/Rec2 [Enterococcus termitis]